MKKTLFILFAIIALAAGLRFYQLGSVPPSPDWDEAALGYNAYSILKTGRDEYGTFLPLIIRSFDDYKPPMYVYLTVPSVALFGLSVWATRLPSAAMGVLAVLGVYFLVKELLRDKKNDAVPLLSSFLLAISPWHVVFSRIAFEANIGLTINIWAVVYFLVGLRKRIFFPVSAVLFGLGMYTYHSERVFLPLLLLVLAASFWKQLDVKNNKKHLVMSLVIGMLVILPLLPVFFSKTAMLRMKATSVFTDQTNLLSRDIKKLEDDKRTGDTIGLLLDNRRIVWVKTVIAGYLSHYSFVWLFLTGDNPRHHAPDTGLLYFWELPFLLYGMFYMLKTRNPASPAGRQEPGTKLLFGWLLIAPVAAASTTGVPHAVRTLVFLPTFQIFTAVGIVSFFTVLYHIRKIFRYGITFLVLVCVLFNIVYFLDLYFIHTNPEYSEYWQYGYKEAVAYTEANKLNYEKIVVSTTLDQSYMFFLFYTKYDPALYLAGGGTRSGSFEEMNNRFDTYEFRKIDWSRERRDGTILYVGDPKDMPRGNVMNYTFLNGKPAIEMADRPNGAP
jgi:4-amino-4-deoxy-L-arabinose transferase-like glycosyltransferase